MPDKFKRLSCKDLPDEVRSLIEEIRQSDQQIVFEDEDHQPVACLTLLPDADSKQRTAAGQQLKELLDSVPPSPYSEEETYKLIDEAIAEVRKEMRQQSAR